MAEFPRHRQQRLAPRRRLTWRFPPINPWTLLPSAVVVLLALIGPNHASACQSSDGPQFRCWIESSSLREGAS